MDATKFADGFSKRLREIERVITRLEKRASEASEQTKQNEAVQAQIQALEGKREAVLEERESLRKEFATASFEDDSAALQQIKKRRAAIDKAVEELDADILRLSESLNTVDSGTAAAIAAELDCVKLPNIDDFIEEMRFALDNQRDALKSRISSAKDTVPYVYSQDEYDSARADKDERYRSYLAREARLAEKDKARRDAMTTISNTGDFATPRRNTDPIIKVVSDGEKQPSYEGPTDSGVLSGDEVHRILREKQARQDNDAA